MQGSIITAWDCHYCQALTVTGAAAVGLSHHEAAVPCADFDTVAGCCLQRQLKPNCSSAQQQVAHLGNWQFPFLTAGWKHARPVVHGVWLPLLFLLICSGLVSWCDLICVAIAKVQQYCNEWQRAYCSLGCA